MSFVVTAPDAIAAAVGQLTGIGSALHGATSAAAHSTTGLVAAAADEVSTAVAQFFGGYAQDFQTVSAQASTFHTEFVSLLGGGAAAYLDTDVASAESELRYGIQKGAYSRLFGNTTANLQALGTNWSARPFPFLNQISANQQRYGRQLAINVGNIFQTAPPIEAAPNTIQASTQQFLTFDAVGRTREIVATQIGFGQTIGREMDGATRDLVAGLPDYSTRMHKAYHEALAGNFDFAADEVAKAQLRLLITGYEVDNITLAIEGDSFDVAVHPKLLGPLGHLLNVANVPGQNVQYLSDLMPPGTFPRFVTQNLAHTINTLAVPGVSVLLLADIDPLGVQFDADFGVPLALTYAMLGPPVTMLDAIASSSDAFQDAVAAGNGLGALGVLIDAPAVAVDGFLNGEDFIDATVSIDLPAPLDKTIPITFHVPYSGLLVPPRHITTTVDLRPLDIDSFEFTIGGTPFAGLVPLLVHYLPQRLAATVMSAG